MHDGRHAIPLGLLGRKLPPSSGSDCIESGLPVVVGETPVGPHKAALLQAHEPRVQRAHIESERTARDLLEARGDRVAVQRAERGDSLQDHEIERTLEDVSLGLLSVRHTNGVSVVLLECQMNNGSVGNRIGMAERQPSSVATDPEKSRRPGIRRPVQAHAVQPSAGGGGGSAHREFTRINIDLTILYKKIEEDLW